MRRANCILAVAAVFGFVAGLAQAGTITVGLDGGYDFNDIQAAVDYASWGDTVLVAPGEYVITESVWVEGKRVTLRSQAGPEVTTIRISPTDPNRRNVVTFWQTATDGSVVDGFTMADGEGWYNPVHDAYGGGGILCMHSTVTIANCRITRCSASQPGGGILLYDGDRTTITNCTIWDNTAGEDGGGMTFIYSENVTVSNCTVFGNSAPYAGGVDVWNSSATITNSILWGNSAPIGPQVDLVGDLDVSYSDVENGQDGVHQWPGSTLNWGPGNIDADPYFADADNNDFHLKSEAGRWDPYSETWVCDEVTSPCIDGGDPNSDYSAEPSPHGSRINMGAFGGTTEASKCRLKAYNPSPTDGATDVPDNVVLSWSPRLAVTSHDVYFGTGFDDVNDANTSSDEYKGRQNPDANSYDPPEQLELLRTYYWRIDEFDDPCVSKGNVWSFTTVDYVVIDDMEDYNDTDNRIYDTWTDGRENGTGSVIGLGTDPGDPVHGGRQSMIFDYYNMLALYKYSEAYRTFNDPCDWTIFGVKAFVLYFYGKPGNDANEQMYLGVEDSRGPVSYVEGRYGDAGEDMNDIKEQEWHEWNLELQDFNDAGVILTDVNRVYIGFGDRDNPVPGGSGRVYFDDIRLLRYSSSCWDATECAGQPWGDASCNGSIDFADLAALKASFFKSKGQEDYNCCADFDQDEAVNFADLAILKANFFTSGYSPSTGNQDCPP